jgi:hypothetical protein
MEIDLHNGIRSAFGFVPERYTVEKEVRDMLKSNGFEVYVHDLNHDGKLFRSRKIFNKRVKKINRYIHQWEAQGFRAGAMHHNLEWIGELDIEYDMSTFDTDPFEPMPEGVGTVWPFMYTPDKKSPYVEIPYTMPQDSTLFLLLTLKDTSIWEKKLDWIARMGGMVLVNTHPDYMRFGTKDDDRYPLDYYKQLVEICKQRNHESWNALPHEIASFTRSGGSDVEENNMD